jgi:3-hydroxyisobutyryl-CoA hydrolase
MPETQIGLFTGNGASYFFPRIKGGIELGLYLALTGKRVKGKEMIDFELATHFVASKSIQQLS